MSRFGQVGQRSHAGAVTTHVSDASLPEQRHGIGVRVGPGGGGALDGVGHESSAGGKGSVVLVRVATSKQHDVPEAEPAVCFFPGQNVTWLDQAADAVFGCIEQFPDIDHDRFASELPRRDLFGENAPQGACVGQAAAGAGDRVRRDVDLGAGVAVDRQHVDVVGCQRADPAVVLQLEHREPRWPGARVVFGDEQREINRVGGLGEGVQPEESQADDGQQADRVVHAQRSPGRDSCFGCRSSPTLPVAIPRAFRWRTARAVRCPVAERLRRP